MKECFHAIVFFPLLFYLHSDAQSYNWAINISSSGNDIGYNVAVDGSSNVYIAGSLPGTADFDPSAGTYTLSPVGGFNYDIFVAKYNSNGNFLWAKSFGSTGVDEGWGIAVDGSSNVYVTGYFEDTADFDPGIGVATLSSNGLQDAFFAKYDANGNYLWAKSFGSTNGNDFGRNITADGSGNVYLTGWFVDIVDFDPGPATANLTAPGGTWPDIYFAKYDLNGNYIFAKSIGGSQIDYGSDISLDNSGNIYIGGYFTNGPVDFDPGGGVANLTSVNSNDAFFAKYDNNGNYLWAKNIGTNNADWTRAIAIDGSGNVHITGYFSSGTADFDPGAGVANLTSVGLQDVFFAKYDANGNYLWAKSIGSVSNDEGRDVAVDASGNVYVTGVFRGTADFDPGAGTVNLTPASNDVFFASYDANGNYLCAEKIGGSSGDQPWSIAVDGSECKYVTGYFTGTVDFDPGTGTANQTAAGGWSIFVAKYCSCSTLLPVELLSFIANCENEKVRLNWQTATEENNHYFSVERSDDGKIWNVIGIMKGAGNSSTIKNYEFDDVELPSQYSILNTQYYRLKQTDYDGKFEYFGPISVTCETTDEWNMILQNISAGDELLATLFLPENANVKVEILNLQGKIISLPFGDDRSGVKGSNLLQFDLKNISNGVYFIKVQTDEKQIIKKFVKL